METSRGADPRIEVLHLPGHVLRALAPLRDLTDARHIGHELLELVCGNAQSHVDDGLAALVGPFLTGLHIAAPRLAVLGDVVGGLRGAVR